MHVRVRIRCRLPLELDLSTRTAVRVGPTLELTRPGHRPFARSIDQFVRSSSLGIGTPTSSFFHSLPRQRSNVPSPPAAQTSSLDAPQTDHSVSSMPVSEGRQSDPS